MGKLGHWIPPVINPPPPPDPPLPPPPKDFPGSVLKRVFVLECQHNPSPDFRRQFKESWEKVTEGTELEGSKVAILPPDLKLVELIGEGLPKVRIDAEGYLVFVEGKKAE